MIREKIREFLIDRIQEKFGDIEIPDFSVEVPENPEHGDYATNAALVLGKMHKKNPLEIAEALVTSLRENHIFEKIEVALPGFINFRLAPEFISKKLKEGVDTEKNPEWDSKKVAIEFTDPNPFKEFHIGHLYTNIVGETISRILEANGAIVKRINYQGDVGLHVAKAIWGMRKKLQITNDKLQNLEKKSLEERIRFMGESYVEGNRAYEENEEAKEEITSLNKKIFDLDPEIKDTYIEGRKWSLEYFERIYKRLGTKFDLYYFEREVGEIGRQIVEENIDKVFEKSDGAIIFNGEKYGLHRRVFINSDGLPTYEAKELGLAPTKYKDFPYDLSLIITGSEVVDYFKVLFAALNLIYPDLATKHKHIPHGMVRLPAGKMSSRTGEVIRAEDLLEEVKKKVMERNAEVAEEVSIGAVKYSFLRVGIGKDIIFDVDTSLNIEGDSGPYLQYTYARFRSILRKIEKNNRKVSQTNMSPKERGLVLMLLRFPEVIKDAADSFSPSAITTYLHNLAMLANDFYHTHPVIQEADEERRNFRIWLIGLLAQTLKKGLAVLGIDAPEKM